MTLRSILTEYKVSPDVLLDAKIGHGTTAGGISVSVRISNDELEVQISVPVYG